MSVNKVILLGNLGKDPELKYTTGGKAICEFTLATSEKWTDASGERKESSTWHKCIAWGKSGEYMKEYLAKGSRIYVEGRINNRSYDDKDGRKVYVSEIIVTTWQFAGERVGKTTEPESSEPAHPNRQEGNDDDLPF